MSFKKISIFIIILSVILAISILFILENRTSNNEKSASINNQHDLDIIYGNDASPLTIVMYSNYSCVHCRKFLIDVFPLIKAKYINTGKVQFRIKLINLSNNYQLLKAYKTAVCLNKFGDFTELNRLFLLETNAIYSDEFNELVDSYIERNSFFAECILNGETESYLLENNKDFIANNIKGTPTFIINNQKIKGYIGYKQLSKIIDKELRK